MILYSYTSYAYGKGDGTILRQSRDIQAQKCDHLMIRIRYNRCLEYSYGYCHG